MALFAAWRLRFGCMARFFSRLRLGVALAAGRFQRDFAVRKEGKGGAPAFDFRHWREFSRDEAHLALLVWFVFCI